MQYTEGILHIEPFLTVTLGIIVLFVGRRLNQVVGFLREYSIPEPVSGGLLFSLLFTALYYAAGVSVEFDLQARDLLLVYFFTTIGINARLQDLVAGGKPLLILLGITLVYMFVQNMTGVVVAGAIGQEPAVGLLGGTVSLIGGHGTAIAWAPKFAASYGVANAVELGIACATFGLILASSLGGPVAKYLVNRHGLTADSGQSASSDSQASDERTQLTAMEFLDAVLAIHISILGGLLLANTLSSVGLDLPLFVTSLFAGILITNFVPKSFPRLTGTQWPSRTPALALIADISLGSFLAMSLMSMQLWSLVDLAGPVFIILLAQVIVALLMILFIVFPLMGRNYDAAVISAGFAGYSMGATPTAMANMSAVTQRYGVSRLAFIVVPLVGAFFIDLANALIIPWFLERI